MNLKLEKKRMPLSSPNSKSALLASSVLINWIFAHWILSIEQILFPNQEIKTNAVLRRCCSRLWRRSWRRRKKWWIGEPAAINACTYFYLQGPWDGVWVGGRFGSVSQLSSFSILCRRLLLTAAVTRQAMIVTYGRGERNDLRALRETQSLETERRLKLSENCAFNAPAVFSLSAAQNLGAVGLKVKPASQLLGWFQSELCRGFILFPYSSPLFFRDILTECCHYIVICSTFIDYNQHNNDMMLGFFFLIPHPLLELPACRDLLYIFPFFVTSFSRSWCLKSFAVQHQTSGPPAETGHYLLVRSDAWSTLGS